MSSRPALPSHNKTERTSASASPRDYSLQPEDRDPLPATFGREEFLESANRMKSLGWVSTDTRPDTSYVRREQRRLFEFLTDFSKASPSGTVDAVDLGVGRNVVVYTGPKGTRVSEETVKLHTTGKIQIDSVNEIPLIRAKNSDGCEELYIATLSQARPACTPQIGKKFTLSIADTHGTATEPPVQREVYSAIVSWELAGGIVDRGDTPDTARLKEAREEIGLPGRLPAQSSKGSSGEQSSIKAPENKSPPDEQSRAEDASTDVDPAAAQSVDDLTVQVLSRTAPEINDTTMFSAYHQRSTTLRVYNGWIGGLMTQCNTRLQRSKSEKRQLQQAHFMTVPTFVTLVREMALQPRPTIAMTPGVSHAAELLGLYFRINYETQYRRPATENALDSLPDAEKAKIANELPSILTSVDADDRVGV